MKMCFKIFFITFIVSQFLINSTSINIPVYSNTQKGNCLIRWNVNNESDSMYVQCGGFNRFSGTYEADPYNNWVIYPVVRALDNKLYPNISIVLNNGNWRSSIWIGTENNEPGDAFEIIFIAIISNDTTTINRYNRIQKSEGRENLGTNLEPNVFVLKAINVFCR